MIKLTNGNGLGTDSFVKLADDLTDGLLATDSQDMIVFANRAAVAMFQKTKEEVIGASLEDLFPNFSNGGHYNDNVPSVTHAVADLALFDDRLPYRLVLLRKAEPDLQGTHRELDQFAHIVSHDLKAPLRAISNLAHWLEEDLGSTITGENRENLSMLRGRVARMEALINGILEYSRIGREQVQWEDVDLFSLFHEIIDLLLPAESLSVHIEDNLPVVRAPRILLHQVFANLVSNAIKHNRKPDGMLKVYAADTVGFFAITVEDNGPGIAEEYFEKIFMIFQTLQARDKFENTGIGLTIVKKILTSLGGRIEVQSQLGVGSKFIVYWPK